MHFMKHFFFKEKKNYYNFDNQHTPLALKNKHTPKNLFFIKTEKNASTRL